MIVVVIKREAADGAASFLGVSCLASETAGTERNAAAEPQTEARRTCGKSIAARDERAVCMEVKRCKPCVGHGGLAGLPGLHGDGLLKFQGGAHELFHLTAIILQLLVALAVSQMKVFEAGEFNLEFCDLFKCEMGEACMRFASQHLADEDREGASVRKHGTMQNLAGQAMT